MVKSGKIVEPFTHRENVQEYQEQYFHASKHFCLETGREKHESDDLCRARILLLIKYNFPISRPDRPPQGFQATSQLVYFGRKIVIFCVFTGETGSLFENPGQYGSPGHAVVVHMDRHLLIFGFRFTKHRDTGLNNIIPLGVSAKPYG